MMQIHGRRVHRWIAAATLLAAASAAAQQQPRQGKLLVFVVVDQLRYQDLLSLRDELGAQGFAGLGQPVPVRYETALTHTAPGATRPLSIPNQGEGAWLCASLGYNASSTRIVWSSLAFSGPR